MRRHDALQQNESSVCKTPTECSLALQAFPLRTRVGLSSDIKGSYERTWSPAGCTDGVSQSRRLLRKSVRTPALQQQMLINLLLKMVAPTRRFLLLLLRV